MAWPPHKKTPSPKVPPPLGRNGPPNSASQDPGPYPFMLPPQINPDLPPMAPPAQKSMGKPNFAPGDQSKGKGINKGKKKFNSALAGLMKAGV